MKYMVGYQLRISDDFIEEIIRYKEHIYEVYFSWADFPNGRNNQLEHESLTLWEAQEKQIWDLQRLSQNGLKLNLLLNGNCYGRHSQAKAFFNKIGDTVDYILSRFGLQSVTTTSPLIAKFLKNNFTNLEVRASVNMKIGSMEGMDYVSHYFDSYYMQREYNRDLAKIKQLKNWCANHGKKLYMLANSGCLNNCSAHTFHDNLVAHETEISMMENAYAFKGICWDYLSDHLKKESYLSITNFVRPEDIDLYEPYFDAVKLATRVNKNPSRVLRAYVHKKYTGSIMDLLEPNHSGIWYPYILENGNISKEFGNTVLHCNKKCNQCNYCKEVYHQSLIKLEGYYANE